MIADIHANLAALDCVLRSLGDYKVDRIVCLGDLVGYGPQPNEVAAKIRDLGIPTVLGNHDLVVAGMDPLERSGVGARTSLEWTLNEVSADIKSYLRSLPKQMRIEGGVLAAHGSIEDPWHYVRRTPDALEEIEKMSLQGDETLLLLGHTHRQLAIDVDRRRVATSEWVLARRRRSLWTPGRAFLNPGSVGQSREPRPLARFAVVDMKAHKVYLHASRYPHELCKEELRKRGLPQEWCHPRPTAKKTVRQVLRDRQDRKWKPSR